MSLKLLKNFEYLMEKTDCQRKLRPEIKTVIKELIANDPYQKTRFEYSLRIRNGRLEKNFRFVNYDNYYPAFKKDLYLARINSIKKMAQNHSDLKSFFNKFFISLEGLISNLLPLYFGIEAKDKEIFLKIYFNFFNLRDKNFASLFLQDFLRKLNLKVKLKKRKFLLFGLTLDKNKILSHKVYYLYKKNFNLAKTNFSSFERKIFDYLNTYNRENFFLITERYQQDKAVSKKIEVKIREDINQKEFLKNLLAISQNSLLYSEIQKIIQKTNGLIEVVIVEKDKLTIYVKLLNYG